jgi:hypothetical protein
MTTEEFTKHLPPFANNPAGTKPPFVFKNMSVRVFPLRASLDALQQVCDGYLNIVPPEVGRFRASVPYVYLALLDYGQISEMMDSIGWFAQAEIYFAIPVEWYKRVDGQWVFHDWAVITPFIFVDDDFSAPLGRTVFGFPKTLANITKTASAWIKDPVTPVTLARVETQVFPELYKGMQLESRDFLEVERAAPMANFQMPPDPMSPIAPWSIAGQLAQAAAGFGRDALRIAQAMRIFHPSPGVHPAFSVEMLNRLMLASAPSGKGFVLNSLNLKQFRNAGHPFHFCYQALTNAGMETMAFNGGGLLGEERTFLGDITGGYTVKLHEYTSLPIARTLGLEVAQRRPGNHGVDVVTLLPVMPFWANLNVKYLKGENLAWRTADGIWRGGNGTRLDPSQTPLGDASTLFNTTVASAIDDAVTGPFRFTGTTVRVLPLLAKRKKLQDFLDKTYINDQLAPGAISKTGQKKFFRLSLWSRPPAEVNSSAPIGGERAYVYMTASSFGGVTSKTNDIGDWAKYELSFLIPVKFECKPEGGEWEIQGVGLLPAYNFVDDSTAALSRSEVLGIPTLRANFMRPESVWLQEGETDLTANQTVLRVDSEVFTAFHVGQKAAILPLVEIRSMALDQDPAGWKSQANPGERAESLRLELGTKNGTAAVHRDEYNLARSLSLEILGNRAPIALYTLKQFPDVADPGKACYQAIVRVSRVLDEVFDIREIEENLRVRIHDFPSLAIVETLGIEAVTVADSSGLTYETQPIRPFYLRATIREQLGERLLSRAGISEWKYSDQVHKGLLGDDPEIAFAVDGRALQMQDQGDPCRMNSLMYQSLQRRPQDDPQRVLQTLESLRTQLDPEDRARIEKEFEHLELTQGVTKKKARDAIRVIDPQMVIESILSREWGNFDDDARWRRGRREALAARELMLSDQAAAFAALKLKDPEFIRNTALLIRSNTAVENAEIKSIQDQIQSGTEAGRTMFVECEAQLYKHLLEHNAHVPGRRSVRKYVTPMIEQMKKFTLLRLEMDDQASILEAWNISRTLGAPDSVPAEVLADASTSLLRAMTDISDLDVLGEPSPHDSTDVDMLADKTRLKALLKVLKENTSMEFHPRLRVTERSRRGRLNSPEAIAHAVRLIEQYREAVQLAARRCNAQRDALLNKLSRTYQKPDFCILRQHAGTEANGLFPRALSWDDAWYSGNDIQVAIFGTANEYEPE